MAADPTSAASMHAAQLRVRHEAQEMQDFLSDLRSWEESAKAKDAKLKAAAESRRASGKASFPASSAATAPSSTTAPTASSTVSDDAPMQGGGDASDAPPEAVEREAGNAHFKKGEFTQAVKCYTRSIALNPRDLLGYSNRSMAYLKLKVHGCEHAL